MSNSILRIAFFQARIVKLHHHSSKVLFFLFLFQAFFSSQLFAQDTSLVVNDVSQLNPIKVSAIITPTTTEEICKAVKNQKGIISISGAKHSMGGQTATENALQIDMRNFNRILNFSKENKEITVQAGITWRKIQEFIDTFNLSVKIMQTYSNFTVGGSLSVNCHGRYISQGPIILSVKEFKIVLANGEAVTASPINNKEIFYGAIGGYGGLGVITEVTLYLTDNCKVEQTYRLMPITKYKKYFIDNIRNDSLVIFHNADIYPNRCKKVRAVSYIKTNKNVTVKYRLTPPNQSYKFNQFALTVISEFPGGKWIRQHIIDPELYSKSKIEWRNYEASYDAIELEPKSRKKSTYVLQEYFVPLDKFDNFYPLMVNTLRHNHVNVINISIRYSKKDPGSTLAWARAEVFAFVLYYKQGMSPKQRKKVKSWTQELTNEAITNDGTYYLPYQVFATEDQFAKAYPDSQKFFELKKRIDPTNKFRNKLWDKYYKM